MQTRSELSRLLSKSDVFNLCHLMPLFQKRCKVCKFIVFRFTFSCNCAICLVKLTVLNLRLLLRATCWDPPLLAATCCGNSIALSKKGEEQNTYSACVTDLGWVPILCFSSLEFLEIDFAKINFVKRGFTKLHFLKTSCIAFAFYIFAKFILSPIPIWLSGFASDGVGGQNRRPFSIPTLVPGGGGAKPDCHLVSLEHPILWNNAKIHAKGDETPKGHPTGLGVLWAL